MIQSVKGKLAVEPFPENKVTTESTQGAVGMGRIKQGAKLVRLALVFKGDNPATTHVWVPTELFAQPWAQKKIELNGLQFIMLPTSVVELEEYDKAHHEVLCSR